MSGRALTVLLFVLPFSVGTSATVWLGLRAPTRYVSRMTIQRQQMSEATDRAVERGDEELEVLSRSRAEFQTIARELQSFKRIDGALSTVMDKSEDADDWADHVEAVRRDVDVAFGNSNGSEGYTFEIRFRAADPVFGPHFLKALGEQFLSEANERKRNVAERQAGRLEARISTCLREISTLEEKRVQTRGIKPSAPVGEREDDEGISPGATAASTEPSPSLEESDLLRDLNFKKANYQDLLEQRTRISDLQRKSAGEAPAFKALSWPEERGEEVGKRFSGVALLAAAVGSVLGLLGALGSMLIQDARSNRSRF